MINDRFNNDSKGGLKEKLRDKKFISIVAIGIFVLILVIVLIAKGCGGKSEPTTEPAAQEKIAQADNEAYPESTPVEETDEERGRKLLQEGMNYYNGNGGKPQDYEKARECFVEAKNLGIKDADACLKWCELKLKKTRKK